MHFLDDNDLCFHTVEPRSGGPATNGIPPIIDKNSVSLPCFVQFSLLAQTEFRL